MKKLLITAAIAVVLTVLAVLAMGMRIVHGVVGGEMFVFLLPFLFSYGILPMIHDLKGEKGE